MCECEGEGEVEGEGDGVWEGRRWDQTAGDDLKWYKENFERQEEHIGIFFGFFNGI